MPKVTKITVSAEFKLAQHYQTVMVGASCEVELVEGDNCSQVRREYGLSLRKQLRAEAEEAINALIDQRPEQALGTSAGVAVK